MENREDQTQNLISQVLCKKFSEEYSVKDLIAQLRGNLTRLQELYLQCSTKPHRSGYEQWLADNYYVIEKESKQCIRGLRAFVRGEKDTGLCAVYLVLYAVYYNGEYPLSQNALDEIVQCVNNVQHLRVRQLDFLPVALKTALLSIAHRACCETEDPAEANRLIGFAIKSLSDLPEIDFEEVIAQGSIVEQILKNDPAMIYSDMAKETKSYYRHIVAAIARKCGQSEQETASNLLQRACNDVSEQKHVGFLIMQGNPHSKRAKSKGRTAIVLNFALPLALCVLIGWWTQNLLTALFIYFPLLETTGVLTRYFALLRTPVAHIPRMDFAQNTVERPTTAVVVSTLLPPVNDAGKLRTRLEQLYSANSGERCYYCILADFKESEYPTNPQDDAMVKASEKVIEELNRCYGKHFMLFVRKRSFSKTQDKYSGWERKRGAITELIREMKGDPSSLQTFAGDVQALRRVQYLVALDSDTSLHFQSVDTLLSAAVHPLNRPVIDMEKGVVTSGYGILTPRMATKLSSAKATLFSSIMAGCGGISTYDMECSDFYQDLFGDAIFAGKGLIDVDAFYLLLNSRFPENQVLSHDILEGSYLRTGFLSDVEMTDSEPSGMTAWLSRLHRWIRGDWQNIRFLKRRFRTENRTWYNPISLLSRYKLFDNLRRSLSPVFSLLCVLAAVFMCQPESRTVALIGALAVIFAPCFAALLSVVKGGFFTISRKFFAKTLPHTFELLGQGLFSMIMLPQQAGMAVDAVIRSLYRTFVSHKNMLEWTTAAQSDHSAQKFSSIVRRYWISELLGITMLFFTPYGYTRLLGLAFASIIPVVYVSSRRRVERPPMLDELNREKLLSYNASMLKFYEDFANSENNWLPPDNVQQSPVYRIANRTSPTNIGMMLLSYLAARDFGFIDSQQLFERVSRTLNTIDRLEKWQGNLYNWYDTQTLARLEPSFVSAVDSGNYLCCLVALKEGFKEYATGTPDLGWLAERIETILEQTTLRPFYAENRKLFSIGYDASSRMMNASHYDFLMSEARMTSYYAVAKKQVDAKHWGTLSRTMSRNGSYAGAVSWTGTMFEYFMPHLLLPAYDGSLLSEALNYCLYCQKKRVKPLKIPWGISESAYYAFDNGLNYQYKAHGVQKVGVKQGLGDELVLSPYSTFITLTHNPNSAMRNLQELEQMGMLGAYGFYEAVDFTPNRIGNAEFMVIRSYMAHHIGMSMVASANALFDNRMQERFMKDRDMKTAKEFLQEKISRGTVVYDDLGAQDFQRREPNSGVSSGPVEQISPVHPQASILTNGELTDVVTDCGANFLRFGEYDLTRRSYDLLRKAQGVFALVKTAGMAIPATQAPFYDESVRYNVRFESRETVYTAQKGTLELRQTCRIHPSISCEQRQLSVINHSSVPVHAEVLFYLEPVLSAFGDYNAHPAFSKLFVVSRYNPETKTITFARRTRSAKEELFLTVGLLEELPFSFELKRENLMSAPDGLRDLLDFDSTEFSGEMSTPDGCCAIKLSLSVATEMSAEATLLISPSTTEQQGIENIINLRRAGAVDVQEAAYSPIVSDTIEARLGFSILGQLIFSSPDSVQALTALKQNALGQNSLWQTGISGDLPIVVIEYGNGFDEQRLAAFVGLQKMLRLYKLEYDLCILYPDAAKEHVEKMIAKAVIQTDAGQVMRIRGGIFLIDTTHTEEAVVTLIKACAGHIAGGVIGQLAGFGYAPMPLLPVKPAPMPQEDVLDVDGGAFSDHRFYVDKTSPLPYSHILANPCFGTLVSDKSLGFTWFVNSRENKVTPWYNDIATGNDGEMLLLRIGGRCYNLLDGARASYSRVGAYYEGMAGTVQFRVKVTIGETGCAKYLDISLLSTESAVQTVQCAYYIEPVLGVDRTTKKFVQGRIVQEKIVLFNPYNTAVRSYTVLSSDHTAPVITFDRSAFLSGNWDSFSFIPNNDPCAAVVVQKHLPAKRQQTIRFIMSCGATRQSAQSMNVLKLPNRTAQTNTIEISTPDLYLNRFINDFAPHQILASRIWGRTAFYQCGGAYGFRDQLQDVCAYLIIDPELAKRQIFRCCAVQFEEGDVLHWWHSLPKNQGGLRGVRTRYSDDLLWLPYTVCEYIEKTGDYEILQKKIAYIEAEELSENEAEHYLTPARSQEKESVYMHCIRAIERAHRLGEKDLPLMGCGDWNDGFNRVGINGEGMSVWLGMFLAHVLERFLPILQHEKDEFRLSLYRSRADALKKAVDEQAWDGKWYLRAFYDNLEPMGSHTETECKIDLLPQSFAVIAGMPDHERVTQALDSCMKLLVDREYRIVKLYDKAFSASQQNPGYAKAYPPGIRENGGQYTHSAVWLALALLKDGRAEDGYEILQMLNPAFRCADPNLGKLYKTEPYTMAADIYTHPNSYARGGWSMYTGAASWYYRTVIEYLLGIHVCADGVRVEPCIPALWNRFTAYLCIRGTKIDLEVVRGGESGMSVDGVSAERIPLDQGTHHVTVIL